VGACVMTFESRDNAAKVAPASSMHGGHHGSARERERAAAAERQLKVLQCTTQFVLSLLPKWKK